MQHCDSDGQMMLFSLEEADEIYARPPKRKSGTLKAPPQKDNKKPILRISEEGSVEIRRPFFLRISEEGADSRLAVRAPAI